MCTRALWADAGGAVLAGRNMDWMEDMRTNLWAFPSGMVRDDGLDAALTWTSAYGSLVAGAHDLMTVDGINQAALRRISSFSRSPTTASGTRAARR